MSPDFNDDDDDPDPVPYADLENPQTLNLYSYVANNPLSGVDPDGHFGGCESGDESTGCNQQVEAFQVSQENEFLGQSQQQAQQQLPYPVTTVTVNGGDGGCNPSSDTLCGMLLSNYLNNMRWNMRITVPILAGAAALYSKAHGQGERNRAATAGGSSNEDKANKKARYDPKTKKWWVKDQNGKRKDLGSGFQPTPEQIKMQAWP